MSSSGGHQHSKSRAIPTRTVPISDSSQLPHDYCTTPGGTLFSTTPGVFSHLERCRGLKQTAKNQFQLKFVIASRLADPFRRWLIAIGTRIIYDRKFLLDRRNSPMAQTPPCHLPNIPGVTSPGTMTEDSKVEVNNLNNHDGKPIIGDDAQFEMDI
uniref:Eukaryotic translation initiation factor 4E-binding protein 2 n=1 Tax=Sphaerodactylus townsendi TaxID=933632 RepID=A0ACB8F8M4_9SAUR